MPTVVDDRHHVIIDFLEKQGGLSLKALRLAQILYFGEFRKSKRPFISHYLETVRVATMCGSLRSGLTDEEIVEMAVDLLTHDIFEDGKETLENLAKMFSVVIAQDQETLSKKGKSREEYYAALLKKYILVIVKACDRIANLWDLDAFPLEKQKDYLRETKEYVGPMIDKAIVIYPEHTMVLKYLRGELEEKISNNENRIKTEEFSK